MISCRTQQPEVFKDSLSLSLSFCCHFPISSIIHLLSIEAVLPQLSSTLFILFLFIV